MLSAGMSGNPLEKGKVAYSTSKKYQHGRNGFLPVVIAV